MVVKFTHRACDSLRTIFLVIAIGTLSPCSIDAQDCVRWVCSARGHRSCSRGIVLRRHSFWYGTATALQLGNPLLKTCDLAILLGALLQHLRDQRLGLLLRCLRLRQAPQDSRVRHAQLYVHARVAIESLRPRRMVSTTYMPSESTR
jgi:hypothetical protein